MSNFLLSSEGSDRRVFKTPIIFPLSVVLVIIVFVGYTVFHFASEEIGMALTITSISFETFLICEIGFVLLILYNKRQLDRFLIRYPFIDGNAALEALKPVIRTNMYSTLFVLFFLWIASLMAIMSILNQSLIRGMIVAMTAIVSVGMMRGYNRSERKIRQIHCKDKGLEDQLMKVLKCWQTKAFPNF